MGSGCDSIKKPLKKRAAISQTEARKDGQLHGQEGNHQAQRGRAVKPGSGASIPRLKAILREEERKDRLFGAGHKQRLTNKQIHQKLVDEGFDISGISINIALADIRKRQREVFIRQQYELGDRLEYDFGEVFLDCGEGVKTYRMAVLSSPGGGFRWLYLYTNQKKAVFMDSHVRFFEMMGGAYHEIVYDNLRMSSASSSGRMKRNSMRIW